MYMLMYGKVPLPHTCFSLMEQKMGESATGLNIEHVIWHK